MTKYSQRIAPSSMTSCQHCMPMATPLSGRTSGLHASWADCIRDEVFYSTLGYSPTTMFLFLREEAA